MTRAVWAIGEAEDGRLVSSSPGVATLARELAGDDAVGVVVDAGDGAADELSAYVPHVLLARAPAGEFVTPATKAAFVAGLVRDRQPSYVLVPGTASGREFAGALSALLQWGVLANAIAASWEDRLVAHSVVFRTDVRVRSCFTTGHGIVTLQPHAIRASATGAVATLEMIKPPPDAFSGQIRRTELVTQAVPTPVEGARVVVAGGAGVGSDEAWTLVDALAAALNGAVGASRPAVDRGWVPYSQQIGQTGKTVRPDLYLALGISGEVQHRVGMRMAKTVVAIDTDPEAAFAQYADLFVNADLNEIVPLLVEHINAVRQEEGSP